MTQHIPGRDIITGSVEGADGARVTAVKITYMAGLDQILVSRSSSPPTIATPAESATWQATR